MDLEVGLTPQALLHSTTRDTNQDVGMSRACLAGRQGRDSLVSMLDRRSAAYVLIVFGGLQWDDILHQLWSSFIIVMEIIFFATGLLICFTYNFRPSELLFIACILCQGASVIICTYYNSIRLRGSHNDTDTEAIGFWGPYVSVLTVVLIVIGSLTGLILAFVSDSQDGTIVTIVPVVITAFVLMNVVLCANLLFILADAEVISRSIESLSRALHDRPSSLSIKMIIAVRQEIHRRMSEGWVASTTLIGTAVINVIIVLASFVVSNHLSLTEELLIVCYREVVIAFVAFWYVALVNEKYDKLIHDVEAYISTNCFAESVKTELCWLLLSLQSNPLTISLMGMTLRRKDVLFRFSLWLFGILLSIATKHF